VKLDTLLLLQVRDGAELVLLLRAPYDRPAPVPRRRGHKPGSAFEATAHLLDTLETLEADGLIERFPAGETLGGRGTFYRCTEKGEEVRTAFLQSARLVGLDAFDQKPHRRGARLPAGDRSAVAAAAPVDPEAVLVRAGHPPLKEGLRAVRCPVCAAAPGAPCGSGGETFAGFIHAGRKRAAKAQEVEGS
jgi:hypothetical protein